MRALRVSRDPETGFKCGKLVSTSGFKFNVRRYNVVEPLVAAGHRVVVFVSTEDEAPLDGADGNSGDGSGGSGDGGDGDGGGGGGGGGGGRGGGLSGSSRDFVPVLERLHREHGVLFEIESSPLPVSPPPACVAAIVDRFAPRTLKLHGPRYAEELLHKFRMRQWADEMRRRWEASSGVKFAWVVGRGYACQTKLVLARGGIKLS
jgi:hypothetical protein